MGLIAYLGTRNVNSRTTKRHEVPKKIEVKQDYDTLYDRMKTLADKANEPDGFFSLKEQADAWRRMGFKGIYEESKGTAQFQKPTVEQLEKAIESYENERNNQK